MFLPRLIIIWFNFGDFMSPSAQSVNLLILLLCCVWFGISAETPDEMCTLLTLHLQARSVIWIHRMFTNTMCYLTLKLTVWFSWLQIHMTAWDVHQSLQQQVGGGCCGATGAQPESNGILRNAASFHKYASTSLPATPPSGRAWPLTPHLSLLPLYLKLIHVLL